MWDITTGLQNNLNRWYDPAVGRWISEDPIGFSANDANLKRYVGNQPLLWTDPIGLFGCNWASTIPNNHVSNRVKVSKVIPDGSGVWLIEQMVDRLRKEVDANNNEVSVTSNTMTWYGWIHLQYKGAMPVDCNLTNTIQLVRVVDAKTGLPHFTKQPEDLHDKRISDADGWGVDSFTSDKDPFIAGYPPNHNRYFSKGKLDWTSVSDQPGHEGIPNLTGRPSRLLRYEFETYVVAYDEDDRTKLRVLSGVQWSFVERKATVITGFVGGMPRYQTIDVTDWNFPTLITAPSRLGPALSRFNSEHTTNYVIRE